MYINGHKGTMVRTNTYFQWSCETFDKSLEVGTHPVRVCHYVLQSNEIMPRERQIHIEHRSVPWLWPYLITIWSAMACSYLFPDLLMGSGGAVIPARSSSLICQPFSLRATTWDRVRGNLGFSWRRFLRVLFKKHAGSRGGAVCGGVSPGSEGKTGRGARKLFSGRVLGEKLGLCFYPHLPSYISAPFWTSSLLEIQRMKEKLPCFYARR